MSTRGRVLFLPKSHCQPQYCKKFKNCMVHLNEYGRNSCTVNLRTLPEISFFLHKIGFDLNFNFLQASVEVVRHSHEQGGVENSADPLVAPRLLSLGPVHATMQCGKPVLCVCVSHAVFNTPWVCVFCCKSQCNPNDAPNADRQCSALSCIGARGAVHF